MCRYAICFSGLYGAALALTLTAWAQTAPAPEAAPRSVSLFKILCLHQLPALDDIAKAAGFGEYAEMDGDELEPLRSQIPDEELRAWRFHEPTGEFVLTAAKSSPDALLQAEAPEFAKATRYACSLLVPPSDPEAEVLNGLTQVLGHAPDESRQDGLRRVHVWREHSAKQLSQVYYYPSQPGGGASMLSASTLLKN
jgi:hypothetical protein